MTPPDTVLPLGSIANKNQACVILMHAAAIAAKRVIVASIGPEYTTIEDLGRE